MLNEVRHIGFGCPDKRIGMTNTWLALPYLIMITGFVLDISK